MKIIRLNAIMDHISVIHGAFFNLVGIMYQVIIIIHVLLGLCVVFLILMQHGKGADAGAGFGSGSSGSVFGAQGNASFLSRSTAILAALFFTTSLSLAVINGQQSTTKDLIVNTSKQVIIPVKSERAEIPVPVEK